MTESEQSEFHSRDHKMRQEIHRFVGHKGFKVLRMRWLPDQT